MSIVRLRKAFRRKMKLGVGKYKVALSSMDIIFWAIVAIFVVGAYYTFGAPGGGGGGQDQQAAGRKVTKNMAIVDGQAITRMEFESRYFPMASDMPQAQLVTRDRWEKTNLLEGMIQRIVMLNAAKKEGITVSKADVAAKVDEVVQEQMDQRFPNRKALAKFLRKRQQTVEQYKKEIRSKMLEDEDAIREQVLFEKLEESVKSRVTVSDKDLEDKYTKVKARHILIMPSRLQQDDEAAKADEKGKDGEAAKPDEEKKDEPKKDYDALAKKRVDELYERLTKGKEDFAALAAENSHDLGSAARGGMLSSTRPPDPGSADQSPSDYFGHGEMVPEFDEAAFGLKKDEISKPVKTNYGYHIVQLLDRKVEYPADYKDKKDDYRNELLEEKKTQAWTDYMKNLRESSQVQYEDPEIAAYKALEDDKKSEAATLLAQAVEQDPQSVGAKYQLATLLKEAGEKTKAIDYLRELAESERASSSPQVRMELGDLLLEQDMKKEALEQYEAASQWAQTYDYQSMFIHEQVKTKYQELKNDEGVKTEQAWLDEFNAYQQQQMQFMPTQ